MRTADLMGNLTFRRLENPPILDSSPRFLYRSRWFSSQLRHAMSMLDFRSVTGVINISNQGWTLVTLLLRTANIVVDADPTNNTPWEPTRLQHGLIDRRSFRLITATNSHKQPPMNRVWQPLHITALTAWGFLGCWHNLAPVVNIPNVNRFVFNHHECDFCQCLQNNCRQIKITQLFTLSYLMGCYWWVIIASVTITGAKGREWRKDP